MIGRYAPNILKLLQIHQMVLSQPYFMILKALLLSPAQQFINPSSGHVKSSYQKW